MTPSSGMGYGGCANYYADGSGLSDCYPTGLKCNGRDYCAYIECDETGGSWMCASWDTNCPE